MIEVIEIDLISPKVKSLIRNAYIRHVFKEGQLKELDDNTADHFCFL
jgi:hypothetical protein